MVSLQFYGNLKNGPSNARNGPHMSTMEWEITGDEINELARKLMRRKDRAMAARDMVNLAGLTCAYVRWLVRNHWELAREISKEIEAWPTLVGPRKELILDDREIPFCIREVLALPIGENRPFKT